MPEIRPFRGILYNQSKVDISQVVAPPYDVISPEQQAHLYDRDQYNVVRLVLGREEDRYTTAAQHFERWQKEKILMRDQQPAIYVLVQTFQTHEGKTHQRKGFIALCKLEEFSKGGILPHEKTLSQPREDRLKLLMKTKANFSQIFGLYSNQDKRIGKTLESVEQCPPLVNVDFEGVNNKLWRITDRESISSIAHEMLTKEILIADGHHRYETALSFRNMMKAQNPKHNRQELYNYVMMYFTNIDDEGLVILPTHRLVHGLKNFHPENFLKGLKKYFELQTKTVRAEFFQGLKALKSYAFGIALANHPSYVLARLQSERLLSEMVPNRLPDEIKKLDVTILHSYIIGKLLGITHQAQEQQSNLVYVKDADVAVHSVEQGKVQLAFLMNPTRIEQVRAVSKAGYTMPQKSTYFYPKLLSGLVINTLE